jgi:hypothetical protein
VKIFLAVTLLVSVSPNLEGTNPEVDRAFQAVCRKFKSGSLIASFTVVARKRVLEERASFQIAALISAIGPTVLVLLS